MRKKRLIRAVYEKDLDEFLENAGLLEDFQKGNLKCAICGDIINIENISRFVIQDGNILLVCIQPSCRELEGVEDIAD